jgi:hypothetical protein
MVIRIPEFCRVRGTTILEGGVEYREVLSLATVQVSNSIRPASISRRSVCSRYTRPLFTLVCSVLKYTLEA